MTGVPDFVYIDKLVKEYQAYREAPPMEHCSPDETVEKIMKCFDTGDYPTILYLWDNSVSQRLGTADPLVVHEASVAEFYMHVHCATTPFRQTTIANLPNPGAAAKLAARSMTIFKHYVETKGKALAATPEFHVSSVNYCRNAGQTFAMSCSDINLHFCIGIQELA